MADLELDVRALSCLRRIVLCAQQRRAALRAVRDVAPEGAWLCAGFVRNAVFTALFGAQREPYPTDLDVIYLDERDTDAGRDRALERALATVSPGDWQVKNQARMRRRHGHAPYHDLSEALATFPETASAVAVRLRGAGLEVLAPHGLRDLFAGVVRATPRIAPATYRARLIEKRWAQRWPGVRVVPLAEEPTR